MHTGTDALHVDLDHLLARRLERREQRLRELAEAYDDRVDRLIASSVQRAAQTAAVIAEKLGFTPEAVADRVRSVLR